MLLHGLPDRAARAEALTVDDVGLRPPRVMQK